MMMDQSRRLFFSVKPRFASLILDGAKTVELRRTRPRIEIPTEALVYASGPECALVGTCDVIDVLQYTPRGMWRAVGPRTGIAYPEFRDYFNGCRAAYGLVLANPTRLQNEIALSMLRETLHGFQPPQSFRYLSRWHSDRVLALAS